MKEAEEGVAKVGELILRWIWESSREKPNLADGRAVRAGCRRRRRTTKKERDSSGEAATDAGGGVGSR